MLNDDLLIKPELIKIANSLISDVIDNQAKDKFALIDGKAPYDIIVLPFDSKEFVQKKSKFQNNKYDPSTYLIDYLINKGYEGEEYS